MKLGACVVGLLISMPAFSQEIDWNWNNKAAGLGNGCGPGEVQFISSGNEVSVIFSNLGVELDRGNPAGGVNMKRTCRIVIPAKVRAGWYLGKLSQTLTYGYTRSANTTGSVSAVTEFYEQPAGKMVRQVPTPGMNPYSVPFAQVKTDSFWNVNPDWCQQSDYKGNFKATLVVTGQRSSAAGDIKVSIDGHDIRFDALGDAFLCP